MLLELEHFIYSLYPRQGYGITAASPKIDKQGWRAFCAPPPVDFQELQKLGKVWALQTREEQVVLSLFLGNAKDELDRDGIYSHNIIIPAKDYLGWGAPLLPLVSHFFIDTGKAGSLAPLNINSEDLTVSRKPEMLAGIKSTVLERILERILKDETATVVCPQKNTEQMVHFVSAICQLLPPSARLVPFVTAPLGRSYRNKYGDTRYKLKLIQNRSSFLSGNDEYIEIDQDYEARPAVTPQNKAAHYLVDKFSHDGLQGVTALHTIWEQKEPANSGILAKTSDFVRDVEITQGIISANVVSEMRLKGQKQEAKQYARAIVDGHKWKSPQELAELFTIMMEGSPPQSAGSDIALLIKATESLGAPDRFSIYGEIIKNLPQIGDILVARLMERHGVSFFARIGDLSSYPAISARLLAVGDYASFQSISKEVLKGSISDPVAFEGNLGRVLAEVRKRFSDQVLDFIQHLLTDFSARKDIIARHLQMEDFVPAWVMAHSSKEAKQRLLTHAGKVLEVLRGVLVP